MYVVDHGPNLSWIDQGVAGKKQNYGVPELVVFEVSAQAGLENGSCHLLVAAQLTAAENVLVNLPSVRDEDRRAEIQAAMDAMLPEGV